MSGITHLVDHTQVLPQDRLSGRIHRVCGQHAFSFMAGMALGRMLCAAGSWAAHS